MGKKGGGISWLTAVKRAFRSPSKESEKRNTRRKEDHDHQDEDDEKKREKRRWLFRKVTVQENVPTQTPEKSKASSSVNGAGCSTAEQRHDVAVTAAEATVAKSQAPAEVARINRTSNYAIAQSAAIVIQTSFRGYLARRALRALKGLVKLQALVRGHNVRKQAKMTLRCMQALVRVQSRVLDQRIRLSHDGSSRKSGFNDNSSLWESRNAQDMTDKKSIITSRDGSSIAADDWDDRPHTIEEVKAMLQSRKDAALKREKNLSQAFSQQIWRSGRNSSIGGEDELEEKPKWLDRWMATKPWDNNRARSSTDQKEPIKTVEIDTSQPYSYLGSSFRRPNTPQQQRPNSHTIASPLHRSHNNNIPFSHQSPITPSPSKTRPLQMRSASPRFQREDRTFSNAPQTPSLKSNYHYNGGMSQVCRTSSTATNPSGGAALPNYMAATESAKARLRSQSAPRQRPATPERERNGSVKKRLSYPVPPPESYGHHHQQQHLRTPSFKSVVSGVSHFGVMEQQSNYSSCYTDQSIGGEISPPSTGDLRRWLR